METVARRVEGNRRDVRSFCHFNTDPPQFPSIKVSGEEDSAVIEVYVEQNPIKPVWAFGHPVKRVGRTNQFLRRDEAQRLLETTTGRTWDAYTCEEFTDKDINKATVRDFIGRAGMKRSTPLDDLAGNLRIGTESRFSNAAVLLFGKLPQRFYVEAKLKCARFKGIDSVYFLDERTFEENIFRQLDNAMAFVTRNTKQVV